MNFKLKGAWKRARDEYRYVKVKGWSFQDVGEFWDTVKDYDEIDDETYAYKRRFYDSVGMCGLVDGGRLLDVDCRTGNGMVFYHERGKVGSGVCMGFSEDFLRVCNDRLKKYGVPAETRLLRNLPLGFGSGEFDGILCLETIEHVSHRTRVGFLRELYRVLKDDGEMVLSMPSLLWEPPHWFTAVFGIHHSEGPHNFLSRREILGLLRRSGFRVMQERNTVIIPIGPRWLTRFGEILEKNCYWLVKILGLRRIFICKKRKERLGSGK